MLVVLQRVPIPDAVYWPGRRLLAAVDAIVWPVLGLCTVVATPFQTGIAGALVIALMPLFAIRRLQRAVVENERYRFTTWRWGKPVATLIVIGALLKVALTFAGL